MYAHNQHPELFRKKEKVPFRPFPLSTPVRMSWNTWIDHLLVLRPWFRWFCWNRWTVVLLSKFDRSEIMWVWKENTAQSCLYAILKHHINSRLWMFCFLHIFVGSTPVWYNLRCQWRQNATRGSLAQSFPWWAKPIFIIPVKSQTISTFLSKHC